MLDANREPVLNVQPAPCRAGAGPGRWLASWRLENRSEAPVQIVEAWLPHGRFLGDNLRLEPPLALDPGEAAELELEAACDEAPGTVVENTFLILRLVWRGQVWRLLARHRIEVGPDGMPRPVCEVISVHRVGFSEEGRGSGSGGAAPWS